LPDIIQVELGSFFYSDCFVARDDNNGFTKMIYYNKHGVSIVGFKKVSDEVHDNGFSYFSGNRVRAQ
jgi:hypothetical protein